MAHNGHRGMVAGAVAQPQPAVAAIQTPAVAPPPPAVAAIQTQAVEAVAERIADIEASVSARGLSRDRSTPAVAVVSARGRSRCLSTPAVAAIAPVHSMPDRPPPRSPRAAAVAADQHPQSREVRFNDVNDIIAADVAPVCDSESVAIDGIASDTESVATDSIAGDTASDAEDPAHVPRSRCPMEMTRGRIATHVWHASSIRNNDLEVGNTGVFFGNWGARGSTGQKIERRLLHDRQVTKCPAQLVILAEATPECQTLLETPYAVAEPDHEHNPQSRVQQRPMREHHVVRGQEAAACSLLMAVRTDVAHGIECVYYDVHDDFTYKQKQKLCTARTRMMVSRVDYKQNVGHLGTSLVVMCVHGHCRTMKREKPTKLDEFWNRLASVILARGVKY